MQPLEGITVIALEQAVAAPLATRHLADLGARVIKIERPGVGDFARAYDTTVRGLSSHFVWLNRSKQSMTLDVKAPEAPDVLARLFSCADVFVQNLAPGAAERLSLGAGELRQKYPKLIVRSEEHTSELQSLAYLVCRLLLEKKKTTAFTSHFHQHVHSRRRP